MKKSILALTFASVALLLFAATPNASAQHDVHALLIAPSLRKPAPAFTRTDASGKAVPISAYRGKVVLLNFWATYCGGCVLEIPWFIQVQQEFSHQPFTAVGMAMDIPYDNLKTAGEAWNKINPYVSKHGVNYPILLGDNAMLQLYGITAFPDTYLIDKHGRIAAIYVGVVSKSNVEANIQKLLTE